MVVPSEIRPVNVVSWVGSSGVDGVLLSVPSLKTVLTIRVEDSNDVLEAKNPADGSRQSITFSCLGIDLIHYCSCSVGPSEVQYSTNKDIQWLDYLPSPVLALAVSTKFSAVAMEDGTVSVYSRTGRRYGLSSCFQRACGTIIITSMS